MGFYQRGRNEARHLRCRASKWRCAACSATPDLIFRREAEQGRRSGKTYRISRPRVGLAPFVLHLVQHSGRGAFSRSRSPAPFASPLVLERQVRRMLKDPRSSALV